MSKNSLNVQCNGISLDYDYPSNWPTCSSLATCGAPKLIKGLMESNFDDIQAQKTYVKEGDTIK